jgi:hypothetical protein
MAVTMKNAGFWDLTPCGSCKNRSFAGIGELRTTLAVTSSRSILRRLLVTTNVVPSSPILDILRMEANRSYETSVLTKVTRRNIPEEGILHSHRRENLRSYIFDFCFAWYLGTTYKINGLDLRAYLFIILK